MRGNAARIAVFQRGIQANQTDAADVRGEVQRRPLVSESLGPRGTQPIAVIGIAGQDKQRLGHGVKAGGEQVVPAVAVIRQIAGEHQRIGRQRCQPGESPLKTLQVVVVSGCMDI
jgi:hypothetical protein